MAANEDGKLGTVKIADEVIAVCVLNATIKTKGVHSLSGGLTDNIAKNLLGKDSIYKGIKIVQNDDGVQIDVFVVVDYGVKIPAVAWDIQENVKKEIENMIEMRVLAVNIHVTGVAFNEDQD